MKVKKFFVFMISFNVLFVVFQIVYGLILTSNHTPAVAGGTHGNAAAAVTFGQYSFLPLVFSNMAAGIAFLFSGKIISRS
ncbi:hypothetical protein [Alteribacter keqinensis]|uniref:Uncharacterized protein n=1 Tax=Alteribacter keqinensis TaxID=2483800 RepID=A0A3M7TX27_9BACI|nr:hypothetical protein [Alteribacter keqinensis]RNA69829.1 hypothetical protein EBO34_07810 [Alteribacter keqinensis]